jgi:hypothetical protein
MEDTDKTMVKYLDYGLLNGHTLHLLANTLNKVRIKGFFSLIYLWFLFFQVYNPLLTYQSENEEVDNIDQHRSPASRASMEKENIPQEQTAEETEEAKRDEKV